MLHLGATCRQRAAGTTTRRPVLGEAHGAASHTLPVTHTGVGLTPEALSLLGGRRATLARISLRDVELQPLALPPQLQHDCIRTLCAHSLDAGLCRPAARFSLHQRTFVSARGRHGARTAAFRCVFCVHSTIMPVPPPPRGPPGSCWRRLAARLAAALHIFALPCRWPSSCSPTPCVSKPWRDAVRVCVYAPMPCLQLVAHQLKAAQVSLVPHPVRPPVALDASHPS